jgi:putative transposase
MFDPNVHHRRSLRLKGYDYAQAGAYFVTVCTKGKECLFGEVTAGVMVPNAAGRMVEAVWTELTRYPGVDTDAFVVMPNHVHGIVLLTNVGAGPCACPDENRSENSIPQKRGRPRGVAFEPGQPRGVAPTMNLPAVVHRFKSLTTARYRAEIVSSGWSLFDSRLWQRNYYENEIRNETDFDCIREYIVNNPADWARDEENPENETTHSSTSHSSWKRGKR